MDRFLEKVSNTIDKFNMTDKSERLLACLSGGADSVALLLCLHGLGYDVVACHVNHHLRGEESDRDERFCRELCEKLGIELSVFHADVKKYCSENSLSTEEGARILRYRFFDSMNVDKICTAHSLSDCLETTLFNLSRGTGLKGLSGIPPVRDNIIRPLIECSREEIEDFLEKRGQSYVTDSTNLSDEYSRNKIRHLVVPQLKVLNGALMQSYSKTAERIRTDCDFLEGEADRAFEKCRLEKGYDAESLKKLHESIRRRTVMRILGREGVKVAQDMIEEVDRIICGGGRVNVKGGLHAVCSKGILTFAQGEQLVRKAFESVIINGDGEYIYRGRRITVKLQPLNENFANVHKKFANCCLDYDKIKGEIAVGGRLEGDKIRLVNRDFDSDVRKLINKGFRLQDRNSAVLLRDEDGVVFVEGVGAADRVKITAQTHKLFTFEIS